MSCGDDSLPAQPTVHVATRWLSTGYDAEIRVNRIFTITLTSSKSDLFRLAPFLALGSVNTTGSCIAEERSGTSRGANRKSFGITPARKFRILAHTNPTRQRGL